MKKWKIVIYTILSLFLVYSCANINIENFTIEDAPSLHISGSTEFKENSADNGVVIGSVKILLKDGNFISNSDIIWKKFQSTISSEMPEGLSIGAYRMNNETLSLQISGEAVKNGILDSFDIPIGLLSSIISSDTLDQLSKEDLIKINEMKLKVDFIESTGFTITKDAHTSINVNDGNIELTEDISTTNNGLVDGTFKMISKSFLQPQSDPVYTDYKAYLDGLLPHNLTSTVTVIGQNELDVHIKGNALNHASSNSLSDSFPPGSNKAINLVDDKIFIRMFVSSYNPTTQATLRMNIVFVDQPLTVGWAIASTPPSGQPPVPTTITNTQTATTPAGTTITLGQSSAGANGEFDAYLEQDFTAIGLTMQSYLPTSTMMQRMILNAFNNVSTALGGGVTVTASEDTTNKKIIYHITGKPTHNKPAGHIDTYDIKVSTQASDIKTLFSTGNISNPGYNLHLRFKYVTPAVLITFASTPPITTVAPTTGTQKSAITFTEQTSLANDALTGSFTMTLNNGFEWKAVTGGTYDALIGQLLPTPSGLMPALGGATPHIVKTSNTVLTITTNGAVTMASGDSDDLSTAWSSIVPTTSAGWKNYIVDASDINVTVAPATPPLYINTDMKDQSITIGVTWTLASTPPTGQPPVPTTITNRQNTPTATGRIITLGQSTAGANGEFKGYLDQIFLTTHTMQTLSKAQLTDIATHFQTQMGLLGLRVVATQDTTAEKITYTISGKPTTNRPDPQTDTSDYSILPADLNLLFSGFGSVSSNNFKLHLIFKYVTPQFVFGISWNPYSGINIINFDYIFTEGTSKSNDNLHGEIYIPLDPGFEWKDPTTVAGKATYHTMIQNLTDAFGGATAVLAKSGLGTVASPSRLTITPTGPVTTTTTRTNTNTGVEIRTPWIAGAGRTTSIMGSTQWKDYIVDAVAFDTNYLTNTVLKNIYIKTVMKTAILPNNPIHFSGAHFDSTKKTITLIEDTTSDNDSLSGTIIVTSSTGFDWKNTTDALYAPLKATLTTLFRGATPVLQNVANVLTISASGPTTIGPTDDDTTDPTMTKAQLLNDWSPLLKLPSNVQYSPAGIQFITDLKTGDPYTVEFPTSKGSLIESTIVNTLNMKKANPVVIYIHFKDGSSRSALSISKHTAMINYYESNTTGLKMTMKKIQVLVESVAGSTNTYKLSFDPKTGVATPPAKYVPVPYSSGTGASGAGWGVMYTKDIAKAVSPSFITGNLISSNDYSYSGTILPTTNIAFHL